MWPMLRPHRAIRTRSRMTTATTTDKRRGASKSAGKPALFLCAHAPLDDDRARLESRDLPCELGRIAGIPDREVGALALFERAAVGQPERASRVARRARERFLGRQPEERASHVEHGEDRGAGR